MRTRRRMRRELDTASATTTSVDRRRRRRRSLRPHVRQISLKVVHLNLDIKHSLMYRKFGFNVSRRWSPNFRDVNFRAVNFFLPYCRLNAQGKCFICFCPTVKKTRCFSVTEDFPFGKLPTYIFKTFLVFCGFLS